jgi:hypothetical protein
MVKWIVIGLVVLAALYFFGYPAYKNRQQTIKADNGDFTCQGCDSPEEHARFLKENSGESADTSTNRKINGSRGAAEQAADGDSRSSAATSAPSSPAPAPASGSSSMVAPSDQLATASPVIVPTTGQASALPAGLPASDTESPNAPNGMRFGGSGNYQWYRQGNLTWRIDTATGRSCIIYATMEEWRKEIVMSHGCGRNA